MSILKSYEYPKNDLLDYWWHSLISSLTEKIDVTLMFKYINIIINGATIIIILSYFLDFMILFGVWES